MTPFFTSASSFEELAKQLPAELIATFQQALSLGYWPDGRAMTEQQKSLCLEAISMHPNYSSYQNICH